MINDKIWFKHVLIMNENGVSEKWGEFECLLDTSNLPFLKVLEIKDTYNDLVLSIHHSLFDLIGHFYGIFVKKEYEDIVINQEVLEIPTEWQEEIYLDGLDLITSLSVSNFFNVSSNIVINEYYINNEKIDLIKFNSIEEVKLLQEQFVPFKEKLNFSHRNKIYLDLEKQVQDLKNKKNNINS
jgi:hypothetical protein